MKQTTLASVAAALCLLTLIDPRPPAQAHAPVQSQSEMNEQAYADFRKADDELNRVYVRLVKNWTSRVSPD